MNRRKFLLGMGTAAAGSGVVFGSGAFTQTQVDRDVQLQFADDSGAQVGIAVGDDPNDVASTETDNNTEVRLNFGSNNGLNVDGVTVFRDVLEVTNNIDDNDGSDVHIAVASDDSSDYRRARGRVLATVDTGTSGETDNFDKLKNVISSSDPNVPGDGSDVRDISAEDTLYSDVSKDLRFALTDNTPYDTGVLTIPSGETTSLSFETEAGDDTRTEHQFTYNLRLKAFSSEQFSSPSDLSADDDIFIDSDLSVNYNDTSNVDSF